MIVYYLISLLSMKKKLAAALYFAPMLALAQVQTGGTLLGNLSNLVRSIGRLINLLLPLVVAVALLLFFWGLAKFMMSAGNEEAKESGKSLMLWGIIAFVVMLSVWGIVVFIQKALGIGGSTTILVPQV